MNHIDYFKFPGGEVHVNTKDFTPTLYEISLTSSDAIMEMLLTVDALKRRNRKPVRLLIKYLPYARQDRVAVEGDPLSIKVMCDLINSMEIPQVEVWDCHSDVGLALLNNVRHVPQEKCFKEIYNRYPILGEKVVLVSPDAGATKKTLKVSQATNLPFIQAGKIRDVKTGKISGSEVYGKIESNTHYLIVDDICDGGASFTSLAKILKQDTTNKVSLYVTHGIFSKGLEPFEGLLENIYCANLLNKSLEDRVIRL